MPDALEARLRHAQYYATVLRAANNLYKRGGDRLRQALDLFEAELTNIRNGQSWSETHLHEDDAAAVCSYYADGGRYLISLRLHPRERIRWLESAVAAARRLNDRKAEGVHLGNLASAYTRVGETDKALDH